MILAAALAFLAIVLLYAVVRMLLAAARLIFWLCVALLMPLRWLCR